MQARDVIVAGGGEKVICGPVADGRPCCYDTPLYTPISPVIDKFGLSLA
ncbi:hypothetical protein ACFWIQ_25045 [Kitasatospora sp. NPDC127059]